MDGKHHSRRKLRRAAGWGALFLPLLLGLGGCIETSVHVAVQPDGSGTRQVEIVWEEAALEDLQLADDDVRVLLDLAPERGWTMRRENRPGDGGGSKPHVVFARQTQLSSLADWATGAPDLTMRAAPTSDARLRHDVLVEVGRGRGYRTISYHETLDGTDIRRLLDRIAARHVAELVARAHPELDATTRAEIRGLALGHLGHLDVWVLEDDDVDRATAQLVGALSPDLARLIHGEEPGDERIRETERMLVEIFEHDEGLNEELEESYPGLSLLAFMTLKLEISVPGAIVESNADRTGDGFAAWEVPMWDAINAPLEFSVRSRIED